MYLGLGFGEEDVAVSTPEAGGVPLRSSEVDSLTLPLIKLRSVSLIGRALDSKCAPNDLGSFFSSPCSTRDQLRAAWNPGLSMYCTMWGLVRVPGEDTSCIVDNDTARLPHAVKNAGLASPCFQIV